MGQRSWLEPMARWYLRGDDHFHSPFFTRVKPIEPAGCTLQICCCSDQRGDLNRSRGQQFDALRDFAVGCAGSEDREFSGDDCLKRKLDRWGEVSNEGDTATSADHFETGAYRFISTDDFHGSIGAFSIGPLKYQFDWILGASIDGVGGTEFFGKLQFFVFEIDGNDFREPCDLEGLDTQ